MLRQPPFYVLAQRARLGANQPSCPVGWRDGEAQMQKMQKMETPKRWTLAS